MTSEDIRTVQQVIEAVANAGVGKAIVKVSIGTALLSMKKSVEHMDCPFLLKLDL